MSWFSPRLFLWAFVSGFLMGALLALVAWRPIWAPLIGVAVGVIVALGYLPVAALFGVAGVIEERLERRRLRSRYL